MSSSVGKPKRRQEGEEAHRSSFRESRNFLGGASTPGARIPESDMSEVKMRSVLSHLDKLGPRTAFKLISTIAKEMERSDRDLLWERCLDELPANDESLDTQLLEARIEYHLETAESAVDTLEKLVATHKEDPYALREAARMRFLLAEETAQRRHVEELQEAESDRELAQEYLLSLVGADDGWNAFGLSYVDEQGNPQKSLDREIREASEEYQQAIALEEELRTSGYERYYEEELRTALDWALEAQRLGENNEDLHKLLRDIRSELGYSADAEAIREAEEAVRQDKLDEALTSLSGVQQFRKEATLLRGRLSRVCEHERRGTANRDAINAERNQIAKAILDCVSTWRGKQ